MNNTIATEIFTLRGELDNKVAIACKTLLEQLDLIQKEIESLFENAEFRALNEDDIASDKINISVMTTEPRFRSETTEHKSYDVVIDGFSACYDLEFANKRLSVYRYFMNSDGDVTNSEEIIDEKYNKLEKLLLSGQILAQVLEYVYDN